MSSIVAKLGAIAVAGALIATTAIPAYASLDAPVAPRQQAPAVQSFAVDATVAITAPARDGYAVTMPRPVAPVAPASAPAKINRYTGVAPPAQGYSGAALIQYAAQFVGLVPYGSGNSPTTSFSCDGYTQYVFAGFGISLPRGADHQARLGVRVDQASAVAGDLVYWPGQHIGIYDGAGGMYNSPVWGRYVEHASKLWGSPLFIRLQV
ncbi:C40 family peptidase [Lacisediminihabitans sp.]|jgi:cell wall-associated NlpC family hydrolase|uniref:C40 family peptidase n=1 Tax=Lacisediminihabitans sp. TaxID=2787631 RepID=UPI002F9553E9